MESIMSHRTELSEYKGMWLFVMFDLPVTSSKDRRNYTFFRRTLLKSGFSRLQFSIYARYFSCEDASQTKRKQIQAHLPPNGQVRLLAVTDHQFGKMQVFFGKNLTSTEKPPDQLLLF